MSQNASTGQSSGPVKDGSGIQVGNPVPGNEWPPKQSAAPADVRPRRMTWILAMLIVVLLPIGVALATFLRPSAVPGVEAAPSTPEEGLRDSLDEAPDVLGPTWVRPSWADSVPGVTAFELSATTDVLFANGHHRPSLGVSCGDGQTDVHVTTGGTALIDPQTSGHVVNLTFDDREPRRFQWVVARDQRALFAGDGRAAALLIASARRLRFGFTHYMSGPTSVDFDLRGAGEVIASMAEACGWNG